VSGRVSQPFVECFDLHCKSVLEVVVQLFALAAEDSFELVLLKNNVLLMQNVTI